MSDWDFLWGLSGDDLDFAVMNGYTKEEAYLIDDFDDIDDNDTTLYNKEYLSEVRNKLSRINASLSPRPKFRCYADFEFNCKEDGGDSDDSLEIISVGMVICDKENNIVEEYKAFVKPTVSPKLSVKCRRLTQMFQSEIDTAKDLDVVCQKMLQIMKKYNVQRINVWGNHDKRVLRNDCGLHEAAGLPCESIRKVSRKINDFQYSFMKILDIRKSPSLENIAELLECDTYALHDPLEDAVTLSEISEVVFNEDLTEYYDLVLFLAGEWRNNELRRIKDCIGKENKKYAEIIYDVLREGKNKQDVYVRICKGVRNPKKNSELYKKITPLLKDKS